MYAVYHGPKGLKDIAQRVHDSTLLLAEGKLVLYFFIISNQNQIDEKKNIVNNYLAFRWLFFFPLYRTETGRSHTAK